MELRMLAAVLAAFGNLEIIQPLAFQFLRAVRAVVVMVQVPV
jgi:hypothetical protein